MADSQRYTSSQGAAETHAPTLADVWDRLLKLESRVEAIEKLVRTSAERASREHQELRHEMQRMVGASESMEAMLVHEFHRLRDSQADLWRALRGLKQPSPGDSAQEQAREVNRS